MCSDRRTTVVAVRLVISNHAATTTTRTIPSRLPTNKPTPLVDNRLLLPTVLLIHMPHVSLLPTLIAFIEIKNPANSLETVAIKPILHCGTRPWLNSNKMGANLVRCRSLVEPNGFHMPVQLDAFTVAGYSIDARIIALL
jgi:hypothetical protein